MIKILLTVFAFLLMPMMAFAQEIVPVMSDADFIQLLIASIGGMKGASTLAIIGIVVKLMLAFLNSTMSPRFFRNLHGASKLLLVLGLTYTSGIIGLMSIEGLSFGAAFIHSSSLSAFVVLSNQLYKKFIEKK